MLGDVELEAVLKSAFLIGLGAMSPGPSLAVVIRNTAIGGRLRGVACGIGHGIGFGIYAMLVVAGFHFIITSGGMVYELFRWCGMLLLIWLGVQMLRAAPDDGEGGDELVESQGMGFAEGFLIAFLNPKIAVFLVAVLSIVIEPGMSTSTQVAIGLVGGIIDALWYVFVALTLSGSIILGWMKLNSHLIHRSIGCVLIGAALLLALTAALDYV